MFERYTEKARRVIFFARYECSVLGSSAIGSEHLLLGVLREQPEFVRRYLRVDPSELSVRLTSLGQASPIPTNLDLPLGDDGKRVLARAAEEAERLADQSIRPEHLILGILREEHGAAALVLRSFNIPSVDELRRAIAESVHVARADLKPSEDVFAESSIAQEPKPVMQVRLAPHTVPRIGEAVLFAAPEAETEQYRVVDVRWELSCKPNEQGGVVNGVEIRLRPDHSGPA